MSGVGKAIGSVGGMLSPLISMVPGGGMINAGTNLIGKLFGGGGQGGGQSYNDPLNPGGGANPFGFSSGGGGVDWGQLLGGLGLGAAGLYAANRTGLTSGIGSALGGLVNPQVVNDPRNNATNWFAQMLQNGGNVGQTLGGQGMLPGYQGPWAPGANGLQDAGAGGMQQIFQQFMGQGGGQQQGQDIMSQLRGASQGGQGMNLPPELMAALGMGQGGNSTFGGMASGSNPFLAMLAQSGQGGQTSSGQGMIGQASNWLGSQMDNGTIQNLLKGGNTADIGQIASGLDAARQPGLNRDIRNLREQFSFNGLRNSTDLNAAVAQRQAESESGMMGQLAQIMPQLGATSSQTSLGTLNALSGLAGTQGQLGQMAGQLGLGQGGLLQSGLQGALGSQLGGAQGLMQGGNAQAGLLSSLFGGQQGNQLQALLAQPGAFNMLSQLPGNMAQQLFGMGTTQFGQAQQGVNNQIAGFNQQQSLMPYLMQFLSGAPQQQVMPSWLSQLGQLGIAGATARSSK